MTKLKGRLNVVQVILNTALVIPTPYVSYYATQDKLGNTNKFNATLSQFSWGGIASLVHFLMFTSKKLLCVYIFIYFLLDIYINALSRVPLQ